MSDWDSEDEQRPLRDEIERLTAELAAARKEADGVAQQAADLCTKYLKERDEARDELAAERKKNKLTKLRFQQAQQMIKLLSQRSSTGSERPPSKREVVGSSPSVEATFRDELAAEQERNAAPSEYDLALLAERDALRAALREIAAVQYGLQGIIDECGGDRNKENYFFRKYFGDEVSRYQQIARAALGDSLRIKDGIKDE